jgi:glutaredoxin
MTTSDPQPTLHLYRRTDCELCDETRLLLQSALEERATRGERVPIVREVDIDMDPSLEELFGSRIPVLALDGHQLELATGGRQVRAFLDRTLGRLV